MKKTLNEIKKIIKATDGLTQQGLADICNVSLGTISRWLNGHREIPKDYYQIINDYVGKELFLTTVIKDVKESAKYDLIKSDLLNQLETLNKYGKHYEDLVTHAVYLFRLKDELQNDIDTNGIRITTPTGNGYDKVSDNASIRNLNQVSAQLLRVIKSLGLEEPVVDESLNENDFY